MSPPTPVENIRHDTNFIFWLILIGFIALLVAKSLGSKQ
jgi:hypothetical protein